VAVEFREVSFSRGATRIIDRLSFAIADGETLAVVGRSGAGKSTILKLINCLLLPDAGDVFVQDRSTRSWDVYELRRRIGYVLQEVGLFPHLTVADNVAVVPRLLQWDEGRIRDRVAATLELVGLPSNEFAARMPSEVSGGQRQRVGVARALAADPPILLMDEPFGALDPITRSELHAEFRRIQAHVRKTIVLVTHDLAEAFVLGNRVGVLADGGLAALDTPAAVARSDDPRVRPMLQPLIEASEALRGARA
jgi:osmoprotectant transport system ATP-binding protein